MFKRKRKMQDTVRFIPSQERPAQGHLKPYEFIVSPGTVWGEKRIELPLPPKGPSPVRGPSGTSSGAEGRKRVRCSSCGSTENTGSRCSYCRQLVAA